MPPVRHLSNAPIREALLDIRVDLPAEFSAAAFKDLREAVGATYPKMTEGSRLEANLQFDAAGKFTAESADMGLHAVVFVSGDEKTVAQFRTDGFTLNKLRPYTEWNSIFPEAMRLWSIFSQVATPTSVARIGLRYINEFQLPGGVPSLGRYLHSVPGLSPGAPGRAKGFLTRVISDDELARVGSVVTYSVNELSPSQSQVIFDVDVGCSAVGGTAVAALTPLFATLRERKNAIFFESLTEETLALFG